MSDQQMKSTHVNVIIDGTANKTLNESAKRNDRSKRKEAQVRLVDHLKRFEDMGMGLIRKNKENTHD